MSISEYDSDLLHIEQNIERLHSIEVNKSISVTKTFMEIEEKLGKIRANDD